MPKSLFSLVGPKGSAAFHAFSSILGFKTSIAELNVCATSISSVTNSSSFSNHFHLVHRLYHPVADHFRAGPTLLLSIVSVQLYWNSVNWRKEHFLGARTRSSSRLGQCRWGLSPSARTCACCKGDDSRFLGRRLFSVGSSSYWRRPLFPALLRRNLRRWIRLVLGWSSRLTVENVDVPR